jgi:hypothetical protein
MRGKIDYQGNLVVQPETEAEEFAMRKWGGKRAVASQFFVSGGSDPIRLKEVSIVFAEPRDIPSKADDQAE